MSEIISKIDVKSDYFYNNFSQMERSVLELRQIVEKVKNGGGERS